LNPARELTENINIYKIDSGGGGFSLSERSEKLNYLLICEMHVGFY